MLHATTSLNSFCFQANEEKELARLNREVEERKAEIERLAKLNDEAKEKGEQQSEVLKLQYDKLQAEKAQLALQERAVAQVWCETQHLRQVAKLPASRHIADPIRLIFDFSIS